MNAVSGARHYDCLHSHGYRNGLGVLVEALLLVGTVAGGGAAGKPPPKDEKGFKNWIRNKLKALPSLLERLGVKVVEALPGILE